MQVLGAQLGGGRERRVGVRDAVELLVLLAQALEDLHRVLDARLVTSTRWKRRDEGAVLLEVLAVLLERRRADAAQPAAGERRLEQVADASMLPPRGRARADDRVDLVDEEDGPLDLLQRLETALMRSSKSPR